MKALDMSRIPKYYFENDYLDQRIASVPETEKRFLFVTDVHWDQLNAGHSPALISHVTKQLNLHTVINCGDIFEFQSDKYKALEVAGEYTSIMTDAVRAAHYFPVLGNHDRNSANITKRYGKESEAIYGTPYDLLYEKMFSHTAPYVRADAAPRLDVLPLTEEEKRELHGYMKMHYYYDDTDAGIRYIHMVTGTRDNGIVERVFGICDRAELLLQYDWLYETLLSTPAGYDIVLCAHVVISNVPVGDVITAQITDYYYLKMCEMLTAAKTKERMQIAHNREGERFDLFYTRGGDNLNAYYPDTLHTYDFAEMPNVGKILVMCGDRHWESQCVTRYDENGKYICQTPNADTVIANGDILVICTQTDAIRGTCPEDSRFHAMEKGTVTEQSFDVISLEDDCVRLTHFGAGKDRVFRYQK